MNHPQKIITIEYLYIQNQLKQIWVLCPQLGVIYATLINSITTMKQAECEIFHMLKSENYQKINTYYE